MKTIWQLLPLRVRWLIALAAWGITVFGAWIIGVWCERNLKPERAKSSIAAKPAFKSIA